MKYYLCKYVPPRADFLATLSENEKRLAGEHVAFMNDLLNKGVIVAHGPVIDKAGNYGLSIYQLADDLDISTITSKDPIVMSSIGHYEHYPMLGLTVRGN